MVGKSDGTYSSTRKFLPKTKITKGEAKKMINRLKNKGKRFKLSYDGQVLRIINLPKNYKDYPYILASFPNSYYEKKMWYTKQRTKNDKTPAQTAKILSDEDKDMICAKIISSLKIFAVLCGGFIIFCPLLCIPHFLLIIRIWKTCKDIWVILIVLWQVNDS